MWNFVVTDNVGNKVGELSSKAYDRSVRIPLNGARSCSFRTRIDHPLNETLLDAGATLVKAYRNGTLMFVGPVVTFEENGAGENSGIQFGCFDAAWRLSQLQIGKSTAGYTKGTALAQVTLAAIATDLLQAAAAHTELHGVVLGAMSSTTLTYVGPWWYKSALEALQELSSMLGGFDWQVDPLEPNGTQIGTFKCSDYIGTAAANGIFEYGIGLRNVKSYRRVGNADALLNTAYSLPSGFPDATPGQTVQTATDSASLVKYGKREGVVDSDLQVDALRSKLLQEHVRIRRYPRQTITFEPTILDNPVFGSDYNVGDTVKFRAASNDVKRIDVSQRIYAVEFDIDNEGNEAKTLTLAAE